MIKMILKNAKLYDKNFNKISGDIRVNGGKICEIGDLTPNGGEVIDCTGCLIVPGFIDVHIHGGAGGDTCDGKEAMQKISEYLIGHGVTSFCATTMTLGEEKLTEIMKDAKKFAGNEKGAKLIGLHLEGPFVNYSKKGAQNGKFVRAGTVEEFDRLNEASGGLVKLITIAPESFDSDEFIKEVSKKAVVSVGHSNATYDEAKKAFDCGAEHVTHLFNAMTAFNHRETGVVGGAADTDKVICELICDGHHVAPSMLKIAFKIFGEDRIAVVSDSMKAAGLSDGVYDLGGQEVYVSDNLARLADGTIAASISNICDEFKNLIRFGIDERTALKACTINPAKSVRADKFIGSIAVGKDADLVVLDDDYNIKYVLSKGEMKVK